MAEAIYLTEEGFEKLKAELLGLTTTKRKEIAQKIKTAKEFGDLSENAEYTEAKEEQSFVEGRIAELEHILKNAKVVSNTGEKADTVDVGCTVQVHLEGNSYKYRIVGSAEADPEKGHISHESPIGKALIGKKVGDEVEVDVPAGKIKYIIKKIEG